MSAIKKCVICSKNGGILTCHGCGRTYCVKHVLEHRQELSNQLNGIIQEHDLLQEELERSSSESVLFGHINQWEKESIKKIQATAEAARVDLQQILSRSKRELSKACSDITVNLRSSREAEDFSEKDLHRWLKQLDELKSEMASPSSIHLMEEERSGIRLITIQEITDGRKSPVSLVKTDIYQSSSMNFNTQERFNKTIGPVLLHEGGLLATLNKHYTYGYILGQHHYSSGRQTVRFRIEQTHVPYNIFFGCISSQLTDKKIRCNSESVAGWFGCDKVYRHGSLNINAEIHGYRSNEIVKNDVLHLTFDSQQRHLELFHERTSKRHTLRVDVHKTPFPWQLLVILCRENDSVRILP